MNTVTGFSISIDTIAQSFYKNNQKDHLRQLDSLENIASNGSTWEKNEAMDLLYNLMLHTDNAVASKATSIISRLADDPCQEVNKAAKEAATKFVLLKEDSCGKQGSSRHHESRANQVQASKLFEPDEGTYRMALCISASYCATNSEVGDGVKSKIEGAFRKAQRNDLVSEGEASIVSGLLFSPEAQGKSEYAALMDMALKHFSIDRQNFPASPSSLNESKTESVAAASDSSQDRIEIQRSFVKCNGQSSAQCGQNAVKNAVALHNEKLEGSSIRTATPLTSPITASPLLGGPEDNIDTQRAGDLLEALMGENAPITVLSYADLQSMQQISDTQEQMDFGKAELLRFKNKDSKHFEIVLNTTGLQGLSDEMPSNGHFIAIQGAWNHDKTGIQITVADSINPQGTDHRAYDGMIGELLRKMGFQQ